MYIYIKIHTYKRYSKWMRTDPFVIIINVRSENWSTTFFHLTEILLSSRVLVLETNHDILGVFYSDAETFNNTHRNFENGEFKWVPTVGVPNTRLHLQGKVARRAFAQESLKNVTSPTSARNYTQKAPNPRLPRMFIFWHTFMSIEIKLPLVSVGTPHFFIFFNTRLCYLKQYRTV